MLISQEVKRILMVICYLIIMFMVVLPITYFMSTDNAVANKVTIIDDNITTSVASESNVSDNNVSEVVNKYEQDINITKPKEKIIIKHDVNNSKKVIRKEVVFILHDDYNATMFNNMVESYDLALRIK